MSVGLGATSTIDSVYLYWEAAYGVDYRIQVSDDNSTWHVTVAAPVLAYVRTYGRAAAAVDRPRHDGTGPYVPGTHCTGPGTQRWAMWVTFEVCGTDRSRPF